MTAPDVMARWVSIREGMLSSPKHLSRLDLEFSRCKWITMLLADAGRVVHRPLRGLADLDLFELAYGDHRGNHDRDRRHHKGCRAAEVGLEG